MFRSANKPDTMLAKKLKTQRANSFIPKISNKSNKLVFKPNEIAETFRQFYEELYSAPTHSGSKAHNSQIGSFLNSTELPQIEKTRAEDLTRPITLEEIKEAIKTTKSQGAPGPDGFTNFYYKQCSHQLLPYLHELFNEFLKGPPIKQEFLEAKIIVIPKEDKASEKQVYVLKLSETRRKVAAHIPLSQLISTARVTGLLGESLILPCKYSAYEGTIRMCWGRGYCTSFYCDNEILVTDGNEVIWRKSERYQLLGNTEEGDVSLTIKKLTNNDRGIYCCRVETPGLFNDEITEINVGIQRAPAYSGYQSDSVFSTRNPLTKNVTVPSPLPEPNKDKEESTNTGIQVHLTYIITGIILFSFFPLALIIYKCVIPRLYGNHHCRLCRKNLLAEHGGPFGC
ncbi:uncharacterized protein O3C94_008377 [Discoglossus pictus]